MLRLLPNKQPHFIPGFWGFAVRIVNRFVGLDTPARQTGTRSADQAVESDFEFRMPCRIAHHLINQIHVIVTIPPS